MNWDATVEVRVYKFPQRPATSVRVLECGWTRRAFCTDRTRRWECIQLSAPKIATKVHLTTWTFLGWLFLPLISAQKFSFCLIIPSLIRRWVTQIFRNRNDGIIRSHSYARCHLVIVLWLRIGISSTWIPTIVYEPAEYGLWNNIESRAYRQS